MNTEITNAFKEAMSAGAAVVSPQVDHDGVSYHVIPAGYTLESIEHLQLRPARKKGSQHFADVESFCRFFGIHHRDHALIYATTTADRLSATFTAVLNENGEHPEWRDHRAIFTPVPTVEWTRWKNSDRKPMTQIQFAEFLEENALDIREPDSAKMIEIALELNAKTNVEFNSGVRLQNGNINFKYEETTEARSKGGLDVPSEFKIGVRVFDGSEPYAIRARLRYRINGKALQFWYELINPHLICQDALKSIRVKIEMETEVEILNGTP